MHGAEMPTRAGGRRTALVASRMELSGVMMMPGATTAASRTAVGDEYSSGFTCTLQPTPDSNVTLVPSVNERWRGASA
jgi:hypothetical protein